MSNVVLVTGGSGFLGQAVVKRFLAAGETVVVPWIVEEEVERLRKHVGDTDALITLQASVTDPDGAAAAVHAAREAGRLRTVALLVGGFAQGPVDGTDQGTWDRMVALNATSVFRVAREAFPVLRSNGGGRIVTVAAEPALERGASGMAAYAATKAAVVSLTQSLAREGAEHRITANAVAPRIIDTPANRAAMPDADTSTWLAPAEIAEVMAFLASPLAEAVTGNVLALSRG